MHEKERDLFMRTAGEPRRLREVLQAAHDADEGVGAPDEGLMKVLDDALAKRAGVNLIAIVQEIIRAHLYAAHLEGEQLAASNEYFAGMIRETYL